MWSGRSYGRSFDLRLLDKQHYDCEFGMSATWLISDPHFGHANICRFLNDDGSKLRPWDTPEEMDEVLVSNWNSVVRPKDRVYCLGDVVLS